MIMARTADTLTQTAAAASGRDNTRRKMSQPGSRESAYTYYIVHTFIRMVKLENHGTNQLVADGIGVSKTCAELCMYTMYY